MKASYPVILTPAGRGYVVFVPNLNINTEGGTLAEALDMARDAISIWGITEQDAGRTIPEASDTMPTAVGGQIVRRVEVECLASYLYTAQRDGDAIPVPSDLADVDPVAVSKELDPALPIGKASVHLVSVDIRRG